MEDDLINAEGAEVDGVIVPATGIRVLVATNSVDFGRGMDGLAAYVQETFKADPFSGVIYVSAPSGPIV